MRLDARDKNDPRIGTAIVFLNGVEQKYCVVADDQDGLIVKYALDLKGNPIPNGDEILMETMRGQVRIEFRPSPPIPHAQT